MQFLMSLFVGLLLSVSVSAEPLLEGQVRLESGQPAAGVQVRLFDLTNLHQSVGTTTDETGHFTLSLPASAPGSALPQGFALGQNYPNPFNPSTIIPYQIPTATHVRLEVFNVLGQRVATLVDAERPAGFHTAQWTATDETGQAVGAGVYFYRLVSGGATVSRRMVLIDGQAGSPAAGAAGPIPASAAAHSPADAGVYGLTVSGTGVVAYVNPAFRVGVGEAEIVLEAASGSPRMKRAAGGILGDVNNDGQVNASDLLYVVLYSEDSSITLPNNGDISLGDVNGDGKVDGTDAGLLIRYLADPSDPSLPAGIGEPVGETTTTASQAGKLYWADGGTGEIGRVNLDGSRREILVTGLETPVGIALDVDGGKIYWTDLATDRIQRANLDGSNVENLITTGLETPIGIALDVDGGKIYWTDLATDRIQRANLDGSSRQTLISGLEFPVDLALDVDGGKIYWINAREGRSSIQRANLNGSNVETLVTGLEFPSGIALDVDGGKIYWADREMDRIQRANLNGSNVETVISFLGSPIDIALDVDGGKIYWTDGGTGEIGRANLDGRNVENITTAHTPYHLALGFVPVGQGSESDDLDNEGDSGDDAISTWKLYWANLNGDKLQRANLDGSRIEDLVITKLGNPADLALDVDGGKMYWTDWTTDKIQRANLDGSRIEDLITNRLERPSGIALDVDGGKMYWTDGDTGEIGRANLDGRRRETLITNGLDIPSGIALDVDGGKMYWTDGGTDKIQRANLDGSNVEDLVTTGLRAPSGIALDVDGGKMYWTDGGTDKIQRANLDGSRIEDLVTTGLGNPKGIALDVDGGKMYWTDWGTDPVGTGKIQRANLDGSRRQTLVTGLDGPYAIALGFVPVPVGQGSESDDQGNELSEPGGCFVGRELRPGQSCTYGSNTFRVTSAGQGCVGGICAGTGLYLNDFSATRSGDTWTIVSVP